jgi:DNA/RNA-binding domain of Phe-tRNA-synthetase-like protein
MNISIAKEVFEKFPGYRRGLVIAHGIQNGRSSNELIEQLRAAESQLCSVLDVNAFINPPKSLPGARPTGQWVSNPANIVHRWMR